MNPLDLRDIIAREPFQPFCLRMSDGVTYRVTDPIWIAITAYEVMLGIDPNPETGIPTRSVHLDPANVVETEPIGDL